jgi:hypothetical protein
METKANPDPNGCLARALPDEPFIVLLARDSCAPGALLFWADQRAQLGIESERRQDAQQLTDVIETAEAMEKWREDNDGKWRQQAHEPALTTALPVGLTPALRDILGMMCFQLGKLAHVYHAVGEFVDHAGQPLNQRAEDEQAFVLHKFLLLWVQHGDGWREAASEELRRVADKARAAGVPEKAGG